MAQNPKDETQEQVRAAKVSARFLLACSFAIRCKCIGVREGYTEILLEKNGFTKGEVAEAVAQVHARWSKMTDRQKQAMMKKVGMKQYLKDHPGLRRG